MLSNHSIRFRLMGIMVLTVVGFFIVCAIGLVNLRANLVTDRQLKTQNIAETAAHAVEAFYKQHTDGTLTEDEARTRALAVVRSMRYGNGDYLWVNDQNGVFLAHPSKEGQNFYDKTDPDGVFYIRKFIETAAAGGGVVAYKWQRDANKPPVNKISYVAPFAPWKWVIGTGIYVDDIDSIFWQNMTIVGGVSFLLLAFLSFASFMITRGIVNPLADVTHAMNELAHGDLAIEVRYQDQKDEIGRLSRALETFKTNALEMERMKVEEEKQLEASKRHAANLDASTKTFCAEADSLIASAATAAAQMNGCAQSLSSIASENNQRAETVSRAASEASNNVQMVAAATEQMNASINEISHRVSESARLSSDAVEKAQETNAKVESLSEATQKISHVVELISDIASQTNLLALNATIEAARAGEAGKGFAGVASEVKSLANQTAKATDEISAQISEMQTATSEVVSAIQGIGDTIKSLSDISTSIASSVEQQGAATQEISSNVQRASAEAGAVSHNIGGVTKGVTETQASAVEVLGASNRMQEETKRLRQVVNDFVKSLGKDA